jgi:hypothetical protein
MSDLYDDIVSQRGSVQRLLARIPGFRGYQDKAERRAADTMLRNYIAGELAKRVNRFAAIEKAIIDDGGLSYMSKTRAAKSKLQLYLDRLKAAAPGYSGFFAAVKIGAEELEKLYSFDEAQIRYVDKFDEALATLDQAVKSKEGIDSAVAAIDALAAEANEAFALREDVLTNLNKSL